MHGPTQSVFASSNMARSMTTVSAAARFDRDADRTACALAIVLALFSTDAMAQTARTFYGADGRVLGRSITDSDGVTTYYDAAGRITGRTSPGGDTMTIYGADGRVLGTFTKPQSK